MEDRDNICHNSLSQMNCILPIHIVILRLLIYNAIIVMQVSYRIFCLGEETIDHVKHAAPGGVSSILQLEMF